MPVWYWKAAASAASIPPVFSDYFMEQGLYLPNVYGVSAGALNAIGYAAKQPGRNAQINFRFCQDKRYVSARNMLKYHCAFNLEFIFDVIPKQYIPFDYDTFFSSEVQVHVGATNLTTGRCDFFTKEQMDNKMFPVRASAALPLFSHIFYLNNQPYLWRHRLPDSDCTIHPRRKPEAHYHPDPQSNLHPQTGLQSCR